MQITITMKKSAKLIKIFTGAEASVILLKKRLEDISVSALAKNDFSDAFLGVAPPLLDLYIKESDLSKAESLIKDFISTDLN